MRDSMIGMSNDASSRKLTIGVSAFNRDKQKPCPSLPMIMYQSISQWLTIGPSDGRIWEEKKCYSAVLKYECIKYVVIFHEAWCEISTNVSLRTPSESTRENENTMNWSVFIHLAHEVADKSCYWVCYLNVNFGKSWKHCKKKQMCHKRKFDVILHCQRTWDWPRFT